MSRSRNRWANPVSAAYDQGTAKPKFTLLLSNGLREALAKVSNSNIYPESSISKQIPLPRAEGLTYAGEESSPSGWGQLHLIALGKLGVNVRHFKGYRGQGQERINNSYFSISSDLEMLSIMTITQGLPISSGEVKSAITLTFTKSGSHPRAIWHPDCQ